MPKPKKKKESAKVALRGGKPKKKKIIQRRAEEKSAKEKHKFKAKHRGYDPKTWAELPPLPRGLVARLEAPKVKSKHQSYFEFAENTEKKKKLETTVTTAKEAPPGFNFVPIGDPTMTNTCKELSREQGAMIFIVSSKTENSLQVYDHVDRIGFHFRETIVEQARERVGQLLSKKHPNWNVEVIPDSQEEINKQTDAAIRDLFPRIPNTDRQQIIEHGFQKGKLFHGKEMVGLQPGVPLARRVQLAVLAHIRHTHTRYDMLLKETTWENARRAVEQICLDFILKWRGDEETGRDQMDEILREIVIITDSEDEDDDDDDTDDDSSSDEEGEDSSSASSEESISRPNSAAPVSNTIPHVDDAPRDAVMEGRRNPVRAARAQPDSTEKKAQRGFARYQAAYDDAITRREQNTDFPMDSVRVQPGALSRFTPSPRLDAHGYAANTIPDLHMNHLVREPSRRLDSRMAHRGPEPFHQHHRNTSRTLTYRNQENVRPLAEHPFFQQPERPRLASPVYHPVEQQPMDPRLPIMVRRSPPKHGLQDMLVRSVETPSSDIMMASPRSDGDLVYRTVPQPHDTYQRRVDARRPSPPRRPFIVLDDDSPQVKRRRVVHEDALGHFRPIPLDEQDRYKNISQGGVQHTNHQQVFDGTNEVVPLRRVYESQPRPIGRDFSGREVQLEQRSRDSFQRVASPAFPVSRPLIRSHDMTRGSAVPEQPFIPRFSQPRLEPSRDEFYVLPNSASQHDHRTFEDPMFRPGALRARSPVKYVERGMRHREHQPLRYEAQHESHEQHQSSRPQHNFQGALPPADDHQEYGRAIQPRRQVVVLD